MTTSKLVIAWGRFKEALIKTSPLGADALRPPASEEAIAAAETQLCFSLPEELRALYRIHDGIVPPEDEIPTAFAVCYFIPLLGVDGLVDEHSCWREMPCYPNTGLSAEETKGMIPFAKDFGGNHLLVSCQDGLCTVWRHDHENGLPLKRIASSLAEFLDKECAYIEQGQDIEHLTNYDDDYRYLSGDD